MNSIEDKILKNSNSTNFLVVLDINGTLIKRIYQYDKKSTDNTQSLPTSFNIIGGYRVYYRQNLCELSKFLNSFSNINYVFWSTMNQKNVYMHVKSLEQFGFKKYIGYYDTSHCKIGKEKGNIRAEKWVKDLKVVSNAHNIELDNCILVDDDPLKSTSTNNFIHIKTYNLEKDDNELLNLIDKIKEFMSNKIDMSKC